MSTKTALLYRSRYIYIKFKAKKNLNFESLNFIKKISMILIKSEWMTGLYKVNWSFENWRRGRKKRIFKFPFYKVTFTTFWTLGLIRRQKHFDPFFFDNAWKLGLERDGDKWDREAGGAYQKVKPWLFDQQLLLVGSQVPPCQWHQLPPGLGFRWHQVVGCSHLFSDMISNAKQSKYTINGHPNCRLGMQGSTRICRGNQNID